MKDEYVKSIQVALKKNKYDIKEVIDELVIEGVLIENDREKVMTEVGFDARLRRFSQLLASYDDSTVDQFIAVISQVRSGLAVQLDHSQEQHQRWEQVEERFRKDLSTSPVQLGELAMKLRDAGLLTADETVKIKYSRDQIHDFIGVVSKMKPEKVGELLEGIEKAEYQGTAKILKNAISGSGNTAGLLAPKMTSLAPAGNAAAAEVTSGEKCPAAVAPAQDSPREGQGTDAGDSKPAASMVPAVAPKQKERGFRILSLDGGGVRGMIEATVLAKIQEGLDYPLHTYFDLICGTSTGGILAVALGLLKLKPAQCQVLYEELATEIFPAKTGFRKLCACVFKGAQYDASKLEAVLKRKCGETRTMERSSESDPRVFTVATHKGINDDLFLFRNYDALPGVKQPGCSGCLAWQAAVATASAPTYFHAFKMDGEKYVDGGLMANNPTEKAIIELGRELTEQDLVVSLGTGLKALQLKKGGKLPLMETVSLVKDLTALATETETTHNRVSGHPHCFYPGLKAFGAQGSYANYFRLNPNAGDVSMDSSDGDTLKYLKDVANHWVTDGEGRHAVSALIEKLK